MKERWERAERYSRNGDFLKYFPTQSAGMKRVELGALLAEGIAGTALDSTQLLKVPTGRQVLLKFTMENVGNACLNCTIDTSDVCQNT